MDGGGRARTAAVEAREGGRRCNARGRRRRGRGKARGGDPRVISDDTETNWQKFIFQLLDLHFSYFGPFPYLSFVWGHLELRSARSGHISTKVRLKTGYVFFSSSREQKAVTSSLLLGF